MILDNFLHRREPQPGSVFLATTDKGFKELAANQFRNAAPVVAHANLDPASDLTEPHIDATGVRHNRLTCIQQQVIEGAFQLLRIKPSGTVAFLADGDPDRM